MTSLCLREKLANEAAAAEISHQPQPGIIALDPLRGTSQELRFDQGREGRRLDIMYTAQGETPPAGWPHDDAA